MTNNAKEVFEKRDGMTSQEAQEHENELRNEVFNALGNGAGYDDIEEMMLGEGLEMDYIENLI